MPKVEAGKMHLSVYKQDGQVLVAVTPNVDILAGQDLAMTAEEALMLASELMTLAEIAIEAEKDSDVPNAKFVPEVN